MGGKGRENISRGSGALRRARIGLARLVHRAHAALAQEGQYLELGEQGGQLGHARRLERVCRGSGQGVRRGALPQQAGRANACQRPGRQPRPASGAILRRGRIHFIAIHTSLQRRNRENVTVNLDPKKPFTRSAVKGRVVSRE